MIGRAFLAGVGALLLAACEDTPPPPPVDNPLLWEIASADGQVEGWLYGTIHALPDGVEWQTAAVRSVIDAADFLVLEVAGLDDRAAIQQAFIDEARSVGHPPLADRVDPARRAMLQELAGETPYTASDYRQIETWAAALILLQAIPTEADSANGVDRALALQFADRRIEEFEGAARQFAIFDGLAEEDQRVMLAAVVDQAERRKKAADPVALWLAGDERALAAETSRGMLADPEIREALLGARNRDWALRIRALLEDPPRPLIAVGAAHMVGPDGLIALLEEQGFEVRRLR